MSHESTFMAIHSYIRKGFSRILSVIPTFSENKDAYFQRKYARRMGSIPTFWRKSVVFLENVVVKSRPCGKRCRKIDRLRSVFLVLKNFTYY